MPLRVIKSPAPGVYKVRAYCSDCHALLQESNLLTQKQLVDNWQQTVLNALQFRCEACGHKIPNVHIELRIVDTRFNTETLPENCSFLKIDIEEGKKAYNQLLSKLRDQSKEEYLKATSDNPEAQKEIDEALRNSKPVSVDILEDGTAAVSETPENIGEVIHEVAKKRRSRKSAESNEVSEAKKEEENVLSADGGRVD